MKNPRAQQRTAFRLSELTRSVLLAAGVALALPLAGCWLDGDTSNGSDTGTGGNGGTDGTGGGTGGGTTISGSIVKGPVSGATVSAYAVAADGSIGTTALASGPSGADGSYSLKLASAPTGPVAIVAAGGSYTGEFDGAAVTKASDLMTLIPSVAAAGASSVTVTPLTDMVGMRALTLMGGGKGAADAVSDALSLVATTYGLDAAELAALMPKFDKASLATSGFKLGVVLGALDTCDSKIPGGRGNLFRALSEDLSDGVFDGKKLGTVVTVFGTTHLSISAGTSDFLACVSSYASSGKAVTDAGIKPEEIAPTVTALRGAIVASPATPKSTGLSAGSSGAISSLTYGGKQWVFFAARRKGVVAVDMTDPAAAAPTTKVYADLVATNFGGQEIGGVVPLLGADHPQLLVYAYGSKHVALVDADTGAVDYEADLPLEAVSPVGFSGGSAFIAGAIPDTARDGVWLATADGYIFFDRASKALGQKFSISSPAELAENVGGDVGHGYLFAANYAPGVQIADLASGVSYYMDGMPFQTAFPRMYEPDGGAVDTSLQIGIVTNEDSPDIALIDLKTITKTTVADGRSTFEPAPGGSVALSLGDPTISGSAVDSDSHLVLFMAGYSTDIAVGRLEDPASVAAGSTWQGLSDWRYTRFLSGYSYARDPHAVAVIRNLSDGKSYGYLLDGSATKAFQVDMEAMLAAPAVGGSGVDAHKLVADPTTTGIVRSIEFTPAP